jgi:hypothetical protein
MPDGYAMPDEQEKFIHSENVKNFTLKLAVETRVQEREVLIKLLAEEMTKLPPSAKRN